MHKYKLLFFNSWGKTVPYHTMLWLWLPISLLREKSFWIWFLSFDSRTKDGDHHCRCSTYLSVLFFIMLGSLFVKKLISVLKCSKLATQITGPPRQSDQLSCGINTGPHGRHDLMPCGANAGWQKQSDQLPWVIISGLLWPDAL